MSDCREKRKTIHDIIHSGLNQIAVPNLLGLQSGNTV